MRSGGNGDAGYAFCSFEFVSFSLRGCFRQFR